MLTKEDLLMCDTPPNIRDVSLELYKEMDNRFKKAKKRITSFACMYNCLRTGTVFYIPSGIVNGTVSVYMNYIVHRKINNISPTGITQNGINIGIRREKGIYTPLTILISKASDLEEYIKTEDLKIVKSLEIKDKSGSIIDSISYEFNLKEK